MTYQLLYLPLMQVTVKRKTVEEKNNQDTGSGWKLHIYLKNDPTNNPLTTNPGRDPRV